MMVHSPTGRGDARCVVIDASPPAVMRAKNASTKLGLAGLVARCRTSIIILSTTSHIRFVLLVLVEN